MATMRSIVPCLWFDGQAEEAARFYVGVFERGKIGQISHYTSEGQEIHGQTPGSVMTVDFELDGNRFTALNGGADFKFSEAVSFQIFCDTQQEIDRYWEKLSAGGDPTARQCGWLKDRFGLSWQVVPAEMNAMMDDANREKVSRVMAAMLKMKKLDLAALRRAYEG